GSLLYVLSCSCCTGNQERGWNDPPQFSYGLQARGPQRNLLNKRAVPAADLGTPPLNPPSYSPLGPPPSSIAPPPLHSVCPPSTASRRPVGTIQSQPEADGEPDGDSVLSVLNCALTACRQVVKEQVCNDVAKRLRLLEDSWKGGKLSLPVRSRMDTLSQELQSGHWDAADKIHLSLMVDHVTEVSQWMVGIKRLIAETRKLSPELLEPLKKAEPEASTESDPQSGDQVQDSGDPVQASGVPVQDNKEAVQDSKEPIQDAGSQP
uniref:Steroid receptor RNA activator 1 n=1 Tax=Takifugu rubripes TaxID=31033 RepID=H2T2W5_TAKRU